mmetsp:Transcript_25204/g.62451  ORF Transcript_25204/g.62451 Transcript_25204/m.62451 type:complete len:289 (-) Transcript_25204:786-1652(-)
MYAPRGADGEVGPHVGGRAEGDLVNRTCRGAETLFCMFCRDSRGDAVARRDQLLGAQVKEIVQVGDLLYGNAAGDLQLCGGDVDVVVHLSHHVLDLQTGIHFKEVVLVLSRVVEELHCARVGVAHRLSEPAGGVLHLLDDMSRCDDGRPLLDDLLVAPLDAAVPAAQRHHRAVEVCKDLHFQVPALGDELHDEDGCTLDLVDHLVEVARHLLRLVAHPDAFAAAALCGLEHDGEADALTHGQRLLARLDTGPLDDLDREILGVDVRRQRHAVARPRNTRHLGRLSDYR